MHEVGDYIYLVLIIIAALSSIFKKKKEKTGQSAPQSEKKIPDFKEILKEFLPDDKEQPVPQPVLRPTEIKVPEKPFITYENTTDYSVIKVKKQVNNDIVNNKIHEKIKFEEEDLIDNSVVIEFSTINDARKAFIYSEIFNKKY